METPSPTPHEKASFWTTVPGILTALAGLITAVTALFALFYHPGEKPDGQSTPLPTPTAASARFITVISTNHRDGSDGKYFDFIATELDAALGRTTWDGDTIWASKNPDGRDRRPIKVWRVPAPSNGVGDAHGRYEDRQNKNDWFKRQRIYVFEHPSD